MQATAASKAFEAYIRKTPSLIDMSMTRCVKVHWLVHLDNFLPDIFPWKEAEGTSDETRKRSDMYAARAIEEKLASGMPNWLLEGKKFLEANRVDSSQILRGLSNQGLIPVKTYAQRREDGRVRQTVAWMFPERVASHPVGEALKADPQAAELWKHRDIAEALRSSQVVWDKVTGYNNPIWDGDEICLEERNLDVTFVGRQLLSEMKPRSAQVRGYCGSGITTLWSPRSRKR